MDRIFDGFEVWTEGLEPPTPLQIRTTLYPLFSDPIFFKWQRGEATEQEWLDMIAKIKACYPDQ